MELAIFILLLIAVIVAAIYKTYTNKKRIEMLLEEEVARKRAEEEQRQFREDCVAKVKSGTPIRKVSREMQVPYSTLRHWVKKSEG